MSACEWCWAEAQRRVMFSGGSVTDRYYAVMKEQEAAGDHALCPGVVNRVQDATRPTGGEG